MSLTQIPYGSDGVTILSQSPASGTAAAMLLNNDKALSDNKLSLTGGTLSGSLAFTANGFPNFTSSGNDGDGDPQLSLNFTEGPTMLFSGDYGLFAANITTNQIFLTQASNQVRDGPSIGTNGTNIYTFNGTILDDGSGSMIVSNALTVGGSLFMGYQNAGLIASGNAINTIKGGNTLDDGSGKVIIRGTLTLPISTTSPAHSTATSVAGSGATVHVDTQFAGASGSTAYCLNDLVTLLKAAGIIKS